MTWAFRELYDSITLEAELNQPVLAKGEGWSRHLTHREVDVVMKVAEGKTNRQIAKELGLSNLTVKSHLQRIAVAVGTGRRELIVMEALRAGVIE